MKENKPIKAFIQHIRTKEHYIKLIEILVIDGLLEIFEEELKDDKIDYLLLILNLIGFLEKNRKHYRHFSSDKFETIIILCLDEILTKKFKTNIDENQLQTIMLLIKNRYLFRTFSRKLKDFVIKNYYICKCKCNPCYKSDIVNVNVNVNEN